MKRSLLGRGIISSVGFVLLCGSVSAKPWWQNPVVKNSVDTGYANAGVISIDPHYMNKDENDQHLFLPLASADTDTPGLLYSIPALIAAVSSNDVVPIAVGTPGGLYGNWKGGAVSDDLKCVLTGNGVPGAVTHFASLPLSGPWTKDVTVFDITNTPSEWGIDGIDFSHTSAFLFSDIYNSGERGKIVTWKVVNMSASGLGLVTNTVFTTSLSRIRNVSDAYINGLDLVYYGEGDDGLDVSPRKVCVYDPVANEEYDLVTLYRTNETDVAAADVDIMNVKVGGVGLGQMHLYVQCNDGALYIYNLNDDGKSVGELVRVFTVAEMKTLLVGSPAGTLGSGDRIRCLEFTNDERFGFFCHKPNAGNALLQVVCSQDTERTWWRRPFLQVKEDLPASSPQALNKDEGDQYLLVPSGQTASSPAYLYSIPALRAAASSNDVAPVVAGVQPGTLIYYEDFEGLETTDTLDTVNALGWQICENFTKHSARYSISNGKLITDNLDFGGGVSTDSYAIIKSSELMKPFCTNDYTYQYDVTYLDQTSDNYRYVSLLCNYTGTNVYNTVDLRIRGDGYNQARFGGSWPHYSSDSWTLNAQGKNSLLYKLYGEEFTANSTILGLKNKKATVRVEMSMAKGPRVYVNGMLVSEMDQNTQNWGAIDAYALCFKSSRDIKAEIDNIMVWTGCGVEPILPSVPAGTVIYEENFDGIETSDNTETLEALGWTIVTNTPPGLAHTAHYSIHNGKLTTDNLDATAGGTSCDSYALVKSSDEMRTYCTNDYTYQYDVTYRENSDNGFRYVSLLCNYTGTNVYNTVDLRMHGDGYNQARIGNAWPWYNDTTCPLRAAGTNSMLYMLFGESLTTDLSQLGLKDRTVTVRVEVSMTNGPTVYVNGMLVSKMAANTQNWPALKDGAYAVCFKTSRDIKAEIDNLKIWTGCGVEPAVRGGAISDGALRVLTASVGTPWTSLTLPLNAPWTKNGILVTNDAPEIQFENLDFSHSGSTLYTDYRNAAPPNKIVKWDVVNLSSNGLGLTSNTVFTTALRCVRAVDVYDIGGTDLVYYGEGSVTNSGTGQACVLDPATGVETVLVDGIQDSVMNVKVSGVGSDEMYLYVQCLNGGLYVYELNDNGLSVGSLARAFTSDQMKALLGGVSFTELRSFEVTNDGQYAFFTFAGADGLFVVKSRPLTGTVMTLRSFEPSVIAR